jgi:hypothetical protein
MEKERCTFVLSLQCSSSGLCFAQGGTGCAQERPAEAPKQQPQRQGASPNRLAHCSPADEALPLKDIVVKRLSMWRSFQCRPAIKAN